MELKQLYTNFGFYYLNISSLFVALHSIFSIGNYYIYNDNTCFLPVLQVIKWQCITTIPFSEVSIIIHHIIVLGLTNMIINHYTIFISGESFTPFIYILSTEISTIFLVFKEMFNNNTYTGKYLLEFFGKRNIEIIKKINDSCFVSLFFILRIGLYSKYLIYNKNLYDYYYVNLNYSQYISISVLLYSLYALNINWASILIKILMKPLYKSSILLSYKTSENILQYTYFSSVIGSFFIYNPFYNPIYFIDTAGLCLLSLTSNNYHKLLYEKLSSIYPLESFNVVENNELMWIYIEDILMIHVRCILLVFSSVNLFQPLYENTRFFTEYHSIDLDYLTLYKMKLFMFFVAFIFHVSSGYYFVKGIVNEKIQGNEVGFIPNKSLFNIYCNISKGVPIAISTIIVGTLYKRAEFYNQTNLIVVTLLLFIVNYIQPFYSMNHLMLHLLLFFETIVLCQCNVMENEKYFT